MSPEGRKVGSLKRRVRSHLARSKIKNCTLLWREAHFQAKTHKAPHSRTRCRNSARRCGAKHISKSKCTKHTNLGVLLEDEMLKKCTPLWREADFEVKMCKAPYVRTTFGSCDVEKCTPLWREAHFEVTTLKAPHFRAAFGSWSVVLRGRRKGFCTLSKVSKTWWFCSISKNDGRRGTCEEDLKDTFSLAGAVQETCSSEMLGGQGADFLIGVAFWSIIASGLLRWFCVTGAALRLTWHHFSRGRRNTLDRWSGKIAKRIGTRPSALHSTFHLWRKSRRIASFLMLSTSKIEEVLQLCFVFDVVKFKNWGSLEELLSSSKNWGSLAE